MTAGTDEIFMVLCILFLSSVFEMEKKTIGLLLIGNKMKIKESIKMVCCRLLCFINRLVPKKYDVIIVRPDRIGDFILWLDAAKQLRSFYYDKKICLVCYEMNRLIAEKSGYFDAVVSLNPAKQPLWKSMIGLRADIAILPNTYKYYFYGLIIRSICAKEKITVPAINEEFWKADDRFWNSFTSILPLAFDNVPEYFRNQLTVNELMGIKKDKVHLADLSFLLCDIDIHTPYFVVNLGSSHTAKMWPIEKYVRVAEFVYKKTGWTCLLVGSPNEQDYSRCFQAEYEYDCIDMTGKTDISQMASYIAHANLVMCNDTSAVHFAAALDVKCVCISPRNTFESFTNYRADLIEGRHNLPVTVCWQECPACDNRCFERHCEERTTPYECIMSISPEMVCNKIETLLDK